ncbi:MAG: glycosyltransferase [Terriglobales bacterium]
MRVLTLTYPLTAVSADACGGTEQVAWQVLTRLARQPGIELHWIGAAGSAPIAGVRFRSWEALLARWQLWRAPPKYWSPEDLLDLQARCNAAVVREVQAAPPDVVHNQGGFFCRDAAAVAMPLLFTLHLARRLYPPDWFEARPRQLHLQCVSATQLAEYGAAACCGAIPNGVDLERLPARRAAPPPGAPLVYLGRICEEKAPHRAIEVARRAHRRLWIVGSVAPFPSHQTYFRGRIAPELGRQVRWLAPPQAARKLEILHRAAAVVIPSAIAETSSLVAMEAAACGVPVLAMRQGALAELIRPGVTGWLADSAQELAAAVPDAVAADPHACRAHAQAYFSASRMAAAYAALYRRLLDETGHAKLAA